MRGANARRFEYGRLGDVAWDNVLSEISLGPDGLRVQFDDSDVETGILKGMRHGPAHGPETSDHGAML